MAGARPRICLVWEPDNARFQYIQEKFTFWWESLAKVGVVRVRPVRAVRRSDPPTEIHSTSIILQLLRTLS